MSTHSGMIAPATPARAASQRRLVGAIVLVLCLRAGQGLIQGCWEQATPTPPRADVRYYHDVPADTSLFGQLFMKWDSYWYVHIAAWGYARPAESDGQSAAAFAPLYSYSTRGLAMLGLPLAVSGALLSLACFVATLPVLFRLGCEVHGERLGALLVVLFGLFPSSWVLNMVYTESLFCLVLVSFFVSYVQGRYATAGVWAALLPFGRVAGMVIVPAILADVAWRSWQQRRLASGWEALIGAALGVVALCGFYAVAAGDATAFLGAGQAWFDRAGVAGERLPLLYVIPLRLRDDPFAVVFIVFFVSYFVLAIWMWWHRRDILGWFSVLYMLMLLQTPILNAQMRYLLPLVPMHIVLAGLLLERPRLRLAVLAGLFCLQIVITRGYLAWSLII